mgnify:CR=1 FL=1
MNRFLLVLFLLVAAFGYSQKYADPEYYLVDSLDYDNLSERSKIFVDHYIGYYHSYEDDLYKVSAVYELVRNCYDLEVWPIYNEWVHDFTLQKMEEELSDSLHRIYDQLNIGTLYYRGWFHYDQTKYNQAIKAFNQCYDRYKVIDDPQGMANSLDNVGSVYSTKGDNVTALEYHVKALNIREEIQDTLGLGASWNAIGIIHQSHGDHKSAVEDFEKSIAFHTAAGFKSGLGSAYSNIAFSYSNLGFLDLSVEYHSKSLNIKLELEDKMGQVMEYASFANVQLMWGDTTFAIELTNEGIQLAQEIGDQVGYSRALCYLGYIHLLKDEYEEGLEHIHTAYDIAVKVGSQRQEREALLRLFQGYLRWEKFDESYKNLNKLIDILKKYIQINFAIHPKQKKELYFKTMNEPFQNLYTFAHYTKDERPEITIDLYNNTLLLKGLLLQSTSAMREAILESEDQELIVQYEAWIDLKKEIADAYSKGLETKELEKAANDVEQELVKKSSAFDDFHNGERATWEDIKTNLDKNEVALEFIHYPETMGADTVRMLYSALIVRSDSKRPEMVYLCSEADLEQVLGTVVVNNIEFVKEVYGTMEDTDQELTKLIWEPLKKSLKGVEKIYYAPGGLLHKVAFAALRTDEGEFMSDRFDLVQMGSTAQLIKKEQFEFDGNKVATLFGGVQYNTDSSKYEIWKYLPGSLTETDAIQNIINKDIKVNYFKGLEASEEQFKKIATESNILHIASHGYFYPDPEEVEEVTAVEEETEDGELEFRSANTSNYGVWNFVNNENPLMRSGLAMAGANDAWQRSVFAEGEDGVLSAQEVANLNMSNTELVVLSACETGLGDIKGSEGVYGLQRAFKMAGVHYMIMSLWQVPDKETAEFMTLFYGKLFELKDFRAAFSAAQAEMRKKYDPYFWAAFVLVE